MDAVLRLALVGNPNCGKSALFNALTGHRQKVANYSGVTVERRSGRCVTKSGVQLDIVDLPGVYSLDAVSADQQITCNILAGRQQGEAAPDAVICVVDATKLREHLRFVLELKSTGHRIVVALNMMDLAQRDGFEIDVDVLAKELGVPVIPTVAVRKKGMQALVDHLNERLPEALKQQQKPDTSLAGDYKAMQKEAGRIAQAVIVREGAYHKVSRYIDQVVLHSVAGPLVLFAVMFLMFQAVFAWAEVPMGWIDAFVVWLQDMAITFIPSGFAQNLVVEGVLAGVGSVIIFLPQILILFFFIHLLEQSGYMARAAFLMDRLMSRVGLSGHAFVPLLSSFACAIPGIMAARTIDSQRDRLTTIMIAPLMTCAARLPVYTLIIAAFIPSVTLAGGVNLQGLVMFGLYLAGIVSALVVALVFTLMGTEKTAPRWFMMELPRYRLPTVRDLGLSLLSRAGVFMRRAGTIIMASTVILWGLASYPKPPADADQSDIMYSAAGMLGKWLEFVFAPIGFSWDICIALIPGMAAREVAVAALGTVYAISGSEDAVAESLAGTLQNAWSLPTALAFLAWYVFAPQCLSTLAVTRRETNSWKWPLIMFGYLFILAYVAAGLTYWTAKVILLN